MEHSNIRQRTWWKAEITAGARAGSILSKSDTENKVDRCKNVIGIGVWNYFNEFEAATYSYDYCHHLEYRLRRGYAGSATLSANSQVHATSKGQKAEEVIMRSEESHVLAHIIEGSCSMCQRLWSRVKGWSKFLVQRVRVSSPKCQKY